MKVITVVTLVYASTALQISSRAFSSRNMNFNMILQHSPNMNRRSYISSTISSFISSSILIPKLASAEEAQYENPNIPAGPEERSGLVVLRIAEVAQFQEKILRAVANGDIPDVVISPQQIVFGTKILLKNSNLSGNMQLMIDNEVPRSKRQEAAANAAKTMNTLQEIYTVAESIKRPFEVSEMLMIADLYLKARLQLNSMYEYLPQREKDKYYGYFMKVTEYEKKIAEGVYNPDIDGILKFD